MEYSRYALGALVVVGAVYLACGTAPNAAKSGELPTTGESPTTAVEATASGKVAGPGPAQQATVAQPVKVTAPLAPHVEKALDWLCGAQQPDGGWGAGSHARQDVRDVHAVPTDPATTAVAAMALVRAGNGLTHGDYAATLQKATDYLLRTVEAAKDEGPKITELTGTQPQAKMGQNVDTALTAQFLARVLDESDLADSLRPRVQKALDKCLRKIETSQTGDGSWASGGWAPVLQSAQMSTALELGQLAGRDVDQSKLDQARVYQKGQVQSMPAAGPAAPAGSSGVFETFTTRRDAAAGVSLYASASNMRGVAAESKAAQDLVEAAKRDGRLEKDAKVEATTLEKIGVDKPQAASLAESYAMNAAAKQRSFDENVLDGFGNNGGEEFLSYQMKSESLAIDGGEEWGKWTAKMNERLAKVQNQDGSWSGHHCITSPTFCTATAINCLTAERDVEWLRRSTKVAAK